MENKTEYEKACAECNFTPLTIEDFNKLPEEDRISTFAYHKLTMLHRAANKDKATGKNYVANWLDGSRKWWNWFWAVKDANKASGLGFSFGGTYYDGSITGVGSRLVSKDEETARKLATTLEVAECYDEFLRP